MDWILTIIYTLLLLMFLVILHEFGHFIVGYKSGIKVNEFSVGFGPKIISKVKNGIKISLRWLPLGGYVQFHGEDDEIPDDPLAFNNAPIGRRFLTILAGPVMNILLAVLIAVIALSCYGDYAVTIAKVEDGSPAQTAGIREGDVIAGINGSHIDFYSEFYLQRDIISTSEHVEITVERDGELKTMGVDTVESENGRMMGVSLGLARKTFGFFEAFILSFKWIFLFTWQMLSVLFDSLKHLDASQLSGIVGMTQAVGETVKTGSFENILRLASLLSLNLGIFNLLPFPALDGGRLVFIIIEKIRRKPVSRKVEGYVNFAGLILLFGLMILLTFQDVLRLIKG